MKTLIALITLALLLTIGGCSGLNATATEAQYIANGVAAVESHQASTQPAKDLTANAAFFEQVNLDATTSRLSRYFGSGKVWANASIRVSLWQTAAVSSEISTRAGTGKLTPASMSLAMLIEKQYAANLSAQAAGMPASSLSSAAKLKTALEAPKRKMAASQPTTVSFDLSNLIASLPAALQPWAVQYGPQLLRLGLAEADAEIALLIAGDTETPYRAALSTMTEDELMAESGNVLTSTIAATNAAAATESAEKQAAQAIASLGLSILFSFMGL